MTDSKPPPSTSMVERQWDAEALTVCVYKDRVCLAEDAAEKAADHIRTLLTRQETASAILATGQSQLLFLDHFVTRPGVDWNRVIFYHMDEYLGLAEDHPASFRHYLKERVDQRINARAFHYLQGDTMEPLAECDRYAGLLKSNPVDLCILGIGDNGHLAFNDPPVANFEDPETVKLVKLDAICRQQQVNQGHFDSIDTMPAYAFTLTIPTLCSARKLLCLAQGKHKAKVVQSVLQGPISTRCPASILRRQSHATLLLDPDSAQKVL